MDDFCHGLLWGDDYKSAAALLGSDEAVIRAAWNAAHSRVATDWRLIASLAHELGDTKGLTLSGDALMRVLKRSQANIALTKGGIFGETRNGHHGETTYRLPQVIA